MEPQPRYIGISKLNDYLASNNLGPHGEITVDLQRMIETRLMMAPGTLATRFRNVINRNQEAGITNEDSWTTFSKATHAMITIHSYSELTDQWQSRTCGNHILCDFFIHIISLVDENKIPAFANTIPVRNDENSKKIEIDGSGFVTKQQDKMSTPANTTPKPTAFNLPPPADNTTTSLRSADNITPAAPRPLVNLNPSADTYVPSPASHANTSSEAAAKPSIKVHEPAPQTRSPWSDAPKSAWGEKPKNSHGAFDMKNFMESQAKMYAELTERTMKGILDVVTVMQNRSDERQTELIELIREESEKRDTITERAFDMLERYATAAYRHEPDQLITGPRSYPEIEAPKSVPALEYKSAYAVEEESTVEYKTPPPLKTPSRLEQFGTKDLDGFVNHVSNEVAKKVSKKLTEDKEPAKEFWEDNYMHLPVISDRMRIHELRRIGRRKDAKEAFEKAYNKWAGL